jgi:hypothetical protein
MGYNRDKEIIGDNIIRSMSALRKLHSFRLGREGAINSLCLKYRWLKTSEYGVFDFFVMGLDCMKYLGHGGVYVLLNFDRELVIVVPVRNVCPVLSGSP